MMSYRVKSMGLLSALLAALSITTYSYAIPPFNQLSAYQIRAIQEKTQTDEHIIWQRSPIEVTLPVGKERFITFPEEVQFGYNLEHLPASLFRVENDNQTVYLTAKKPFTTERVEAKLSDGEIILLDINAIYGADDAPIDIVLPKKNISNSQDDTESATNTNVSSQTGNDYVSLTRFAVQQLYAPERLLSQPTHISRFPMGTSHVVPLFYDNSASAMPLASWRGGNLYVTAILIKNLLNQSLRLDPRLICGSWQAATFYPQNTLAAHGTPINRDTSTLLVVSDRPFGQAIQTCLH